MASPRTVALVAVACAACGTGPSTTTSSMPWLTGFPATASSDVAAAGVARRMADLAGDREPDPYGGIQITAELVPGEGAATVLATHRHGILVLDQNGTAIARAPGVPEIGSADEIVSVAAGDGPERAPMIVVAATSGGHRENATTLTMYRLAGEGRLEPVFSGIVEERENSETYTGGITLAREALIYRAPRGVATLWTYDHARHRFVSRAAAPAG